jgi:hypothetical protein
METWHDEPQRLGARVAETRGRAASRAGSAAGKPATPRMARGRGRGNTELLRLVSTQREHVHQIRGEMAVAEERQRNAIAPPARRTEANEARPTEAA